MENLYKYIYFVPFLLIAFLLIIRFPSKATYLLAFTIPLSPYIPIIKSQYAARSAIIMNLSDLLVTGLLAASFFRACLENKVCPKYPLSKSNNSILLLYFALLIITLISRPMNESLFQLVYLLRYSLYLLIGYFVWIYLPVKNIERYIIVLLIALLINSVAGIYLFLDMLYNGGVSLTGIRANGLWSMMIGLGTERGITDPGNFAMYMAMSLIMNIYYLSYMQPHGIKKVLGTMSLFLGFITIHMTLSRTEIFAFWCVSLYLLLFTRRIILRHIIVKFFSLTALAVLALVLYIGVDLFRGTAMRLTGTLSEFQVVEGRYNQVYNLIFYMQDHFTEWWGHGISSWRLYRDEFFIAGITGYRSGSLYSGYATIFWDAGIIGAIVWLFWVKWHFYILKLIRNEREMYWMAMALKAILICFLVSMIATSTPVHNFRLMGYLSFLFGLLLKYSHQKNIERDQVTEKSTAIEWL